MNEYIKRYTRDVNNDFSTLLREIQRGGGGALKTGRGLGAKLKLLRLET